MTILRIKRTKGYTTIPNNALCDTRLSFRARGMLAFLLSKPDDWETRTTDLSDCGKEGRDACRAALAELREAGYVTQERERYDDGQRRGLWRTVTVVSDNAGNSGESDSSTFPETGFQAPETMPELPESVSSSGDGFSGAVLPTRTSTTEVHALERLSSIDGIRRGRIGHAGRGSIKSGWQPKHRSARAAAQAAAAEEAALDPANAPDVVGDDAPPAPRNAAKPSREERVGPAKRLALVFEADGKARYQADGMPEKNAGAFNTGALAGTFNRWLKDGVSEDDITAMIKTFWSDGFSRDLDMAAWRDFLQKKIGIQSQQGRRAQAEQSERDRHDPAAWL